jgi:hypothetical protein
MRASQKPAQHTSRIDAPLPNAQCRLSNPHSNAVVDLNGDCLAGSEIFLYSGNPSLMVFSLPDIFLVCDDSSLQKTYQIWVNNKDEGFTLAQSGKLPGGTQSVTFADISACPPLRRSYPFSSTSLRPRRHCRYAPDNMHQRLPEHGLGDGMLVQHCIQPAAPALCASVAIMVLRKARARWRVVSETRCTLRRRSPV